MRRQMLTAALVVLMAVGSLALWTLIPAGWMYVTREIEPAGARFVLTIFGCVASMVPSCGKTNRAVAFAPVGLSQR